MFKLSGYHADTATGSVKHRRFKDTADTSTSGQGLALPTGVGVMQDIVPTKDPKALRKYTRDMYQFDAIIGATIDLYSNLPFGSFSLSGIPSAKGLKIFQRSCECLRTDTFLPALTVDYMVNGAFIGSMNYDAETRIFDSIVPQDLDNADLVFVPVFGATPLVTLRFPQEWRQFLGDNSPRALKAQRNLSPKMLEALRNGRLDLNVENTLYVPRRTYSYDFKGTPLLNRLIPIYLMEKALLKGSIELAYRRQRAILHVIVGEEDWNPNQTDLDQAADLFARADMDPIGAVLATRTGIQVQEIQPGGEFWRYDSISDQMTALKLRSLGVGEAFLGSDATVQNVENAMNVFLKQLQAYRNLITSEVFYFKLFPLIAATNDLTKSEDEIMEEVAALADVGVAETDGRNARVAEEELDLSKLHIPLITWHTPISNQLQLSEQLDLLKLLQEQGVPIPIRLMASAAGISVQDVLNGKDEDVALRKKLQEYSKEIKAYLPQVSDQTSEDMAKTLLGEPMPPQSIISRDYGDLHDRLTPNLDGRGRRQVKTRTFQAMEDEKINKRIGEAAIRLTS